LPPITQLYRNVYSGRGRPNLKKTAPNWKKLIIGKTLLKGEIKEEVSLNNPPKADTKKGELGKRI